MSDAVALGVLFLIWTVGYLFGRWSVSGLVSATATRETRLDEERKRLDVERRRLLDLQVARTPQEAAGLEREHVAADQPARPVAPPEPWRSHPAVQGFSELKVVTTENGRPAVQCRQGPLGSVRIVKTIPIDELEHGRVETLTPTSPVS